MKRSQVLKVGSKSVDQLSNKDLCIYLLPAFRNFGAYVEGINQK